MKPKLILEKALATQAKQNRRVEELRLLGIEKCLECGCNVGDDWEYVDFTNKTIVKCPQCGETISLNILES